MWRLPVLRPILLFLGHRKQPQCMCNAHPLGFHGPFVVSCTAVRLESWGLVWKSWWCSRTSYLGLCYWGGFSACFLVFFPAKSSWTCCSVYTYSFSLQNIVHMAPWMAEVFLSWLIVNQSCAICLQVHISFTAVSDWLGADYPCSR